MPAAPPMRGQPATERGEPFMSRATNPYQHSYGIWTETFTQLHAAVLAGATTDEVERLTAAELDELLPEEHIERGDR